MAIFAMAAIFLSAAPAIAASQLYVERLHGACSGEVEAWRRTAAQAGIAVDVTAKWSEMEIYENYPDERIQSETAALENRRNNSRSMDPTAQSERYSFNAHLCALSVAQGLNFERGAEVAQQQQPQAAPQLQQAPTRTVTTRTETRTLTGAEAQKALADAQKQIQEAQKMLGGAQITPPAGKERLALNAAKPKEEKKDEIEDVQGEPASDCLHLYQDNAGHDAGLHNGCGYKVHFAWCAYRPVKGTSAQYFNCDNFKAGSSGNDGAEGGTDYGILVHQAKQILWLGCRAPSRPRNVEYRAGEVALYGECG